MLLNEMRHLLLLKCNSRCMLTSSFFMKKTGILNDGLQKFKDVEVMWSNDGVLHILRFYKHNLFSYYFSHIHMFASVKLSV